MNDKDEENEINKNEIEQAIDTHQGRQHLKRKAKAVKNSKYDESNFLVDFSGNHNKHRKINEDGGYCNSL